MQGLLLFSDRNEPVSRNLIEHQKKLQFPLFVLSLEELLNDVEIFDEIIDGTAKIEWTLANGNRITNSNEFFLINRVLSVKENLFANFHPKDREYALAEFRAYLTFALEAFPLASARPNPGGLSGSRFSLPQQWDIVQKSKAGISTPDYYLGNLNYQPFKNNSSVILSTPHNFYYWKPIIPSCKKEDANFCFLRPKGIPIICSIIGKKVFLFPYFQGINQGKFDLEKLTNIGQRFAIIFNYFIGESLLFIDGDNITFGMISNIPYVSKTKDFFASSIIESHNLLISSGKFYEQ